MRTCVSPEGRFVFGVHEPHFSVANLRAEDIILSLGEDEKGHPLMNHTNFPPGDVNETAADIIFEVPNPFPFRGSTFIHKHWADNHAQDPAHIAGAGAPTVSLGQSLQKAFKSTTIDVKRVLLQLPEPMQLALATTSTDPADLRILAESSCQMVWDQASGIPTGLVYAKDAQGRLRPKITNAKLFEAVANNPYLDIAYQQVMVLNPGVQGNSEIVGQWRHKHSHIFEYLRRNSYIPWGHYAVNMAHDAIRYAVGNLTPEDIFGMRHLYYQRSYVRMAEAMEVNSATRRKTMSVHQLEQIRHAVVDTMQSAPSLPFSATLWGWNYGFDYAPTHYRLHASHQQIHQQYALIPHSVRKYGTEEDLIPTYASGDMIQSFVRRYQEVTGRPFFNCYEQAIRTNQRMDGAASKSANLVVYQDDQVFLFVPKAQTSQWELQLMPRSSVGNVFDADTTMRKSLDKAMLVAMRVLCALGATMITVVEFSKRFHIRDKDQRLLYCFLPRLPESPGAFSEAQLRWINGHYPEDFAARCRLHLQQATHGLTD